MPNLPNVDRLHKQFQSEPLFREAVTKGRQFGAPWEFKVDETISHLFPDDDVLHSAVWGYVGFCAEIMRLQVDFNRTGVYAPTPETVDEAYMCSCYLPGLLLSWFLWPHHYRQLRFFEEAFISQMRRHGAEKFYDVGTGTGLYSRLALQGAQSAVGIGYDINPSSCTFTTNHLIAFGLDQRYVMRLCDPIEDTPDPADWVICTEVIEHLADPLTMLKTLRKMTSRKAFITTAINAPSSDHVYLYRDAGEVLAQLTEAGFTVEQYQVNSAESGSAQVAAFVCR